MELHKKYLGGSEPEDWWKFVRNEADLPLANREALLKKLDAERGWEIDWRRRRSFPVRRSNSMSRHSPPTSRDFARRPENG
jgi:CO dehydrogenase/acetyl-CoA synthase alpha subunit